MSNYQLTKHALEEMAIRGIAESTVKAVMESPGQIVSVKDGLVAYQSVISEEGKEILVRVIADNLGNPVRVITVYKTSKISKYWRP